MCDRSVVLLSALETCEEVGFSPHSFARPTLRRLEFLFAAVIEPQDVVFGRDQTFLEEPYDATLDGLEGHDLAHVWLRIQLKTYFSMVVVGDWDQYVYLTNRDIRMSSSTSVATLLSLCSLSLRPIAEFWRAALRRPNETRYYGPCQSRVGAFGFQEKIWSYEEGP